MLVLLEIFITVRPNIWLLKVGIKLFLVEHLRVEGNRTLRNEGGAEDKDGDDGELDAGNVFNSRADAARRGVHAVDVSAQQRLSNGVDNNVCTRKRSVNRMKTRWMLRTCRDKP